MTLIFLETLEGGHYLHALPLLHSRVPISPREELLHVSGAPDFMSGAMDFEAATRDAS